MDDKTDREGANPFGRQMRENTNRIVPKSASQALKPEKGAKPPRRSKKARSQVIVFLNFVMTVMVFVTVVAIGAFIYGKSEMEARGPLEQNKNFMVRQGAGAPEIAESLERARIITSKHVFTMGVRAHLRDDTLKAGEYEIRAGASMLEVMEVLRSGKAILHSITFPEGLTVFQMFDRMRKNEILSGDLPETLPSEGSLFPNTYKFGRGTTRQDIIDQMLAEQIKVVDQVWSHRDRDLPIETKEQLLILASIVEKETGRADERSRVAAVFVNRLRQGIRLQSDPTIIYGIFGGVGKPSGRPIYRSDLDKKTAYNTYKIDGLTPTPIANPGRASLEAVANPSKTDDLFFVADGTGGHAFAVTLDEHNANVKRWREIEKKKAKEAKEKKAE